MTTTFGLVYKDGVLLATESQATAGYMVASKEATKLFRVVDNVGMTISGGVADCQQIIRNINAMIELRLLEKGVKQATVRSVVQLTSVLLFQNRIFPYISMLICGGYDVVGPHLYTLDPFGSILEETKYAGTGSGSVIGIGVLEARYKENMTLEEAAELAKKAINSARKRDTASGSPIQMAKIDKDGFRFLEQ